MRFFRLDWEGCHETMTRAMQMHTPLADLLERGFAQPSPSAWDGGAATFQLPVDYSDEYSAITNYDFKVHFELEATVVNPRLETVFNATATYDHSIVMPELDLSVDLMSLNGLLGCVLGFGINSETRMAYFDEPFRYVPE